MAVYRGEIGLQFTTPLAKRYSVPQWIELAEFARKRGFAQVWINDNLGHRNIFVILTAIAAKVPVKLGTAIFVPYFRNPIDAADAFASLSELMGGRETSVGIARGDYAQAGNQIHLVKPIAMVKTMAFSVGQVPPRSVRRRGSLWPLVWPMARPAMKSRGPGR